MLLTDVSRSCTVAPKSPGGSIPTWSSSRMCGAWSGTPSTAPCSWCEPAKRPPGRLYRGCRRIPTTTPRPDRPSSPAATGKGPPNEVEAGAPLLDIEIGQAGLRVAGRINGLHLDAICARIEFVDGKLESYRNHRISGLNLRGDASQSRVFLHLLGLAVQHAKLHSHNRRSLIHRVRLVDLRVQRDAIRLLEAVQTGGVELESRSDQGSTAFEQDGIQVRSDIGQAMQVFAERQGAETEILTFVRINGNRHLHLSKRSSAGIERGLQGVLARGDVELAVVMIRLRCESLHLLLVLDLQLFVVAEARRHGAVGPIGDCQ